MNEPNQTPDGRLREFLIGDLGVARRHINRLINRQVPAVNGVLEEIQDSIERCVKRIERDMKQGESK